MQPETSSADVNVKEEEMPALIRRRPANPYQLAHTDTTEDSSANISPESTDITSEIQHGARQKQNERSSAVAGANRPRTMFNRELSPDGTLFDALRSVHQDRRQSVSPDSDSTEAEIPIKTSLQLATIVGGSSVFSVGSEGAAGLRCSNSPVTTAVPIIDEDVASSPTVNEGSDMLNQAGPQLTELAMDESQMFVQAWLMLQRQKSIYLALLTSPLENDPMTCAGEGGEPFSLAARQHAAEWWRRLMFHHMIEKLLLHWRSNPQNFLEEFGVSAVPDGEGTDGAHCSFLSVVLSQLSGANQTEDIHQRQHTWVKIFHTLNSVTLLIATVASKWGFHPVLHTTTNTPSTADHGSESDIEMKKCNEVSSKCHVVVWQNESCGASTSTLPPKLPFLWSQCRIQHSANVPVIEDECRCTSDYILEDVLSLSRQLLHEKWPQRRQTGHRSKRSRSVRGNYNEDSVMEPEVNTANYFRASIRRALILDIFQNMAGSTGENCMVNNQSASATSTNQSNYDYSFVLKVAAPFLGSLLLTLCQTTDTVKQWEGKEPQQPHRK